MQTGGDGTAGGSGGQGDVGAGDADGAGAAFGYEVQYLLDAGPAAVETLRRVLDGLGDSLVVVGTGDGVRPTWNVHVHVGPAAIGPAIEAGVVAGRPYRISVTPLDDHRRHHLDVAGHAGSPAAGRGSAPGPLRTEPAESAEPADRAAVVGAAGEGLAALFEAEGATVVGPNPSTGEMLAAVLATGAGAVVLLPNDANSLAVRPLRPGRPWRRAYG